MSNANETNVRKADKKKSDCCGGARAKDGEHPAEPTLAAEQVKSASHAAHDHAKHGHSGTGCCGVEKPKT